MLLERLTAYAASMPDVAPPMYDFLPVRYIIEIEVHTLHGTIISLTGKESRPADRGLVMAVPTRVRAAAIKPKLLADNAEYALGWIREDGDSEKVAQRHHAFIHLLEECLAATRDQDVQIVHDFLTSEGIAQLERPDDFDVTQTLTFQVNGRRVVDSPTIRGFWESYMSSDSDAGAAKSECLVCGKLVVPVERLQFKIKNVPGGQTSGTSLISANADAFESYGLKASRVSPICDRCAEQFSKALNALIANEHHRLRAGGQLFIFWTEGDTEFSVIDLLGRPEPTDVRELISSVFHGRENYLQDTAPFHALSLSGSGGRLVIRDWIDTTVGAVQTNLARYFALQRVTQPDGSKPRPYGLNALLRSTVRQGSNEDPVPLVPRVLVSAALTGSPVPFWINGQVIRRIRAAQSVTGPQAALLKMVLLGSRHDQYDEEDLVTLDQNETNSAYLCGRLLAVLDATQRAALRTRNATIIDRFFGTASSAPASIFGRLLRGAQPHLARLRRDRPGAYIALEQRMEEIMSNLDGFPKTLSVQEQARFVLGYYHQRAWDRAQARDANERRKRGETPDAEVELIDALEEEGDEDEESNA